MGSINISEVRELLHFVSSTLTAIKKYFITYAVQSFLYKHLEGAVGFLNCDVFTLLQWSFGETAYSE